MPAAPVVDVFSTDVPLPGSFFAAGSDHASALFTDVKALDRWVYEHLPNGYYAEPLLERLELVGEGVLHGEWRALHERLDPLATAHGCTHDFLKDGFACVARHESGFYLRLLSFPDEAGVRRFVEAAGGRWLIARLVDWTSMY